MKTIKNTNLMKTIQEYKNKYTRIQKDHKRRRQNTP